MLVAPLSTAGVSDEVAQRVTDADWSMLNDLEEPMLARPAKLKDPSTPDPIGMERQSDTLPSRPWSKKFVESRGRDSPPREQPKIDAVVPQFQFDYKYMGDGGTCRLRASLWDQAPLLEPSTRR